jgi:hypothetical protein
MQRTNRFRTLLLSAGIAAGLSVPAFAVPYAANVRNTSGSMWEYVLNEAADNVTVVRDGVPQVIGALSAGRHTFDLMGATTFDIEVTDSTAAGWTWSNPTASLYDDFERPTGLAVNDIPGNLSFFGTVYVNNSSTLTTASGRVMGDGVYAMTSDLVGVNLSDFSTYTDTANAALAPGWTVAGSNNSAWRLSLDDSGNILATDWSDANGGIKYAMRDLSAGGLVLDQEDGPTFGVTNAFGDYLHGSIVSKTYSTGTVGVDLTVYAMDEDMESVPFTSNDGNNIFRWDVGAATNYSGTGSDEPDDLVPTLIIDPGNFVAGAALSPNVSAGSGTDSDGDVWFLNLNVGAIAEMDFNEQHSKWYLTSPRDNGHDSSSIIVTAADDPQTVLWSSKQFSIDNGLDGFIGTGCSPALCDGVNDIFREAWAIDFSADGTKMFLVMSNLYSSASNTNPVIGPLSPNGLDGHILVIPLDENGLPDIVVNDNGTPGDTTDDYLENVESIQLDGVGNMDRVNIDVDAAGNIYVSSNITELMQVFSPGGDTLATTSWDGSTGSFMIGAPPMGLPGDHNGDGRVNAADYALWRSDPDAFGGQQGYDDWVANFGQVQGSGSGSRAAVPEPGTILLAIVGLFAAGACRRRQGA